MRQNFLQGKASKKMREIKIIPMHLAMNSHSLFT